MICSSVNLFLTSSHLSSGLDSRVRHYSNPEGCRANVSDLLTQFSALRSQNGWYKCLSRRVARKRWRAALCLIDANNHLLRAAILAEMPACLIFILCVEYTPIPSYGNATTWA